MSVPKFLRNQIDVLFEMGISIFALPLLLLVVMAPCLAAATPSSYEIDAGLIAIELHIDGDSYFFGTHLESGSFSYDSEGEFVSNLSVSVHGEQFEFDATIDVATAGGLYDINDTTVVLYLSGVAVPDGTLPSFLDPLSPSVTILATATRIDSYSESEIDAPILDQPTNAVPEPSAALLFAAGIVVIQRAGQRRATD